MMRFIKLLLTISYTITSLAGGAGRSYALRPMAARVSSLDEGMFMTETVKSSSTGKKKGIDIQFSDKRKIDKQLEKIIEFLKDGYRPNEDGYKTHIISFWHQPYISTRAAGSIGHFSKKGYTKRVDKEFWQPLEKLLSGVLMDDDSADLKIFFDDLKKILRKSEHVLIRSRSFRVRYATNTLAYAKALELIDRQKEILKRLSIKIASEFQLLLEDIINEFFDSHNEYYGVEQDGTFWVKVFAGDVMRFVLEQSRLGSHLIEAEKVLLSNLDFIRRYSGRFVLFSERKIRSPYDIKDTPISVYNKAIEFLKIGNIYDDHIVDFGCGRGRFLVYLDSRFHTNPFIAPPLHSWGYDNSEVMVKSARNKGLDARKADLSDKRVLNRLTNQLSKTYGYEDSYSDQFNKAVAIDLLQDFTTEGKENFLDFLSSKAFLEKGRCFISLFIGKGDRKRTKEDFLKLIQKRGNLIVEFAEADDSRVYIGVIKKSSTIKSVYNRSTSQARSPKSSAAGKVEADIYDIDPGIFYKAAYGSGDRDGIPVFRNNLGGRERGQVILRACEISELTPEERVYVGLALAEWLHNKRNRVLHADFISNLADNLLSSRHSKSFSMPGVLRLYVAISYPDVNGLDEIDVEAIAYSTVIDSRLSIPLLESNPDNVDNKIRAFKLGLAGMPSLQKDTFLNPMVHDYLNRLMEISPARYFGPARQLLCYAIYRELEYIDDELWLRMPGISSELWREGLIPQPVLIPQPDTPLENMIVTRSKLKEYIFRKIKNTIETLEAAAPQDKGATEILDRIRLAKSSSAGNKNGKINAYCSLAEKRQWVEKAVELTREIIEDDRRKRKTPPSKRQCEMHALLLNCILNSMGIKSQAIGLDYRWLNPHWMGLHYCVLIEDEILADAYPEGNRLFDEWFTGKGFVLFPGDQFYDEYAEGLRQAQIRICRAIQPERLLDYKNYSDQLNSLREIYMSKIDTLAHSFSKASVISKTDLVGSLNIIKAISSAA